MNPSSDRPSLPPSPLRPAAPAQDAPALVWLVAALAVALGGAVLTGWALNIGVLKSVLPGWVTMKPNTALCFMLVGLGLGLGLRQSPGAGVFLSRLCLLLTGLIGLLSLGEYVLGRNLGIDQVLFPELSSAVGTSHPGRMAPDTALCFILCAAGVGSVLRSRRSTITKITSLLLGAAIGTVALIEVFSYFTPSLRTYGWGGLTMMALPTAVMFLLLGAALSWYGVQPEPMGRARPLRTDGRPIAPADLKLILIFALLACGIISTGAYYYRNTERQFRLHAEEQLLSIADLKVRELSAWRGERLGDGNLLFRNPSFSALARRCFAQPADTDAQRLLLDWLSPFLRDGRYDQIRLLDTQGITRLSMPSNVAPASFDTLRLAAEVQRTGQMVLQDFYRHEKSQRIFLQVMIPLLEESPAHRPLGVVQLRIDPSRYLFPFIQSWPVPSQTAETLLIRREANGVLFLNELRFQTDTALALRAPLEHRSLPAVQVALGRTGITEGVDYRGVTVLAALRQIPNSPWGLVAKIDLSELYAPSQAQLWKIILAVCILIYGAGAAVGLIWWQTRLQFYAARHRSEMERLKLSALVESSADAIDSCSLEGLITSWNQGAEQHYGYRAEEVIGKSITLLLPFGRVDELPGFVARIRQGESIQQYETERRRKDGTCLPVSLSLSPVKDAAGTIVGISSIARDITARQQAEAARRKSEADLRRVQAIALIGNWSTDLQSSRVTWSEEIHRIFGTTPGDFEPTPEGIAKYIHPEDAAFRLQAIEAVAQGQNFVPFEFRVIQPNGRVRTVHVFACELERNAAGQPVRVFGALQDITERKQAESQLSAQVSELRRWQQATLGRESRVMTLKQEVNDLLAKGGEPPRYARREDPAPTP